MTMTVDNIIWLIIVSVSYFLLFAFIPFWLRGYKLSGENVIDKLVDTFLYSNTIIILLVSFLSLTGLYNRFTVFVSLTAIAACYRFLFRRKQTLELLVHLKQYFHNFAYGYYHPRVFIRNLFQKSKNFFRNMISKVTNPVGLIFTLIIFGYAIYVRCYHSVTNMFYAVSDMYLHTEWTKFFMHNQPYISGVYPFGFHSVIAAVSSVFNINVVTVMRMFGPISGMLAIFTLYYVLRRTMRSTFAINVALTLYIVTDLFPYWATERQFMALPQEFGTIFLYITAYYLYKYMKNKEIRDLISFSLSVSLTILIHFFVTIYAVLICGAVFIACITYLNRKVFVKLITGVCLALFIAVLPLGGGLLKGIEFNGSMGWALSFFMGGEASETSEEISSEENNVPITIPDIYDALVKSEVFESSNDLSLLNLNWFLPYLAAAILALTAPVFKFKKKGRQWIFMAFSLYSLLVFIFLVLSFLDIFAIMEYSRLYAFYIYSIPLVIGVPFELLHCLLYGKGIIARDVQIVFISALTSLGIFNMGVYQRFMPLGRVWQSQYNGAVLAYYDIVKNFPKNKWIVVSSMTEYSQCLFDGYHYEMTDFIMDMHDYDETCELYLPAENVFIYIVKRPNTYLDSDLLYLGKFEALPKLDENDAFVDLEMVYGAKKGSGMIDIYRNFDANRVLQAKAQSWALEYMKYFPDEMTVFYEDDEIIVYRVEQNPYALNNFAVSYPGNKNSK